MTSAAVVQAFVDRVNDHDVDGLAALLTPDHRFIDSLGSVVAGRESLRRSWAAYFDLVADYRITVKELAETPSALLLVGEAAGRSGGVSWKVPTAWRAIARDGQLAEWQVYADNEPLRASLRSSPPTIRPASSQSDLADVRTLFGEYAAALGFDLGFQGFAEELATLPGAYAAPGGALLLAGAEDGPAGCVGVRPLGPDTCEVKRLYVRPAYRRRGLARRLMAAALAEARRLGYARVRLDTLPSMVEAQRLYRELGFREIAPYRPNPVPGAIFMELALEQAAPR